MDSVPSAWVALPADDEVKGLLGSWGDQPRDARSRLGRARATLRNIGGLLPPAGRIAKTTGSSIGRRFQYDFGFVPNMGKLLLAHRDFGLPFLMSYSRIMFGPSVLTRAEREAIAAVSAAAQDCHY